MYFLVKKTNEMTFTEKESIVNLFNQVFAKERSINDFKDQFENNDLGYSYFGLIKNESNEIVASYAVKPFRYMFQNKEFIFGQSVDTMVRKDYRGNAFNLKKLSEKVYSSLKNDNIAFVFGFPNKEIYLIRKKLLKWRDIGNLDIYITPLFHKNKILHYFFKLSSFIIMLYNSILNIFNTKKTSSPTVNKITFSGEERYRQKNSSFVIKLNDNSKIHYLRYPYKNLYLILLMDLSNLSKDNLIEAIMQISKLEKKANFIVYVGNLNFKQNLMLRIPPFFNISRMKLCGRILLPKLLNEKLLEISNWKINLSNTDFQ